MNEAPPLDVPAELEHMTMPMTGGGYLKLIKAIGSDWRKVGEAVQMPRHVLESIDYQHRRPDDAVRQLLSDIYGMRGSSFKVGPFARVLDSIGLRHAATVCIEAAQSTRAGHSPWTSSPVIVQAPRAVIVQAPKAEEIRAPSAPSMYELGLLQKAAEVPPAQSVPAVGRSMPVPTYGPIHRVAVERIGSRWSELGQFMGLEPHEIDAVRSYGGYLSSSEKADGMLQLVRRKLEAKFTVGFLIDSLEGMGMKDAAEAILHVK
jgi:hypothetical protein